ncbi:MAG: NUDIX domain-containing protein [Thermomicrobiales bacterium]
MRQLLTLITGEQRNEARTLVKVRPSSRLLILDPDDRLLLFKTVGMPMNPDTMIEEYWHVPGGGLEPGETFEEAASRELWEETGISDADIGPCVWIREQILHFPMMGIGEALSHERFFPARVARIEPVFDNLANYESAGIDSYHWWTLDELRATTDVVFPENLPSLLDPVIRGQLPEQPMTIR